MELSEMSSFARILKRAYDANRRPREDVELALNSGKITQEEYEEILK